MATESDIALMRDWLKKQKHLPQDVEDHCIYKFILAGKGSLQRAKTIFEKYHMFRHKIDNMDRIGWDPFAEDELFYTNNIAFLWLPKKSPEGFKVFVAKKLSSEATEKFFIWAVAHLFYYIQIQLWEDNMGDCQIIVVLDYSNVAVGDLKYINATTLKIISEGFTNGGVLRVKAIHAVNVPQYCKWIYNFSSSFMPDKVKERMFLHSNLESFYKHIPKEDLPSDYGGDAPSMAELYEATTMKQWQQHRERLREQKTLIQREKPFVPAHFEDSSATFRKLNVD